VFVGLTEKGFLQQITSTGQSLNGLRISIPIARIECRRNSFVVVLCSVKFVSIVKSDVVGYISHCFLVLIRGVVFHMRIIQVILTCAEQVVGSLPLD